MSRAARESQPVHGDALGRPSNMDQLNNAAAAVRSEPKALAAFEAWLSRAGKIVLDPLAVSHFNGGGAGPCGLSAMSAEGSIESMSITGSPMADCGD